MIIELFMVQLRMVRFIYFLDNTVLANNSRIGSTELIEAIDKEIKPSHIGVVSSDGKEVIPFVNKTIKLISDGILLVEKSGPESENVKGSFKFT